MSSSIIFMMIGVSFIVLFSIILIFLWAIRGKQFDDDHKFIVLDDSEESLNEAVTLEKRKEEALKKKGLK